MSGCGVALLGWFAALGAPAVLGAAALAPSPCSRERNLKSQEDVLELAASRCEEIGGKLEISGDVRDLRPLAGLRKINGSLTIAGTRQLPSLDGLETLEQLGTGPGDTGRLSLQHNEALESIAALRGLRALNSGLTLTSNRKLATLEGLENLTEIGQGCMLQCSMSLKLTNNLVLRNLSALSGVRSSLRGIKLQRNPRLTSLDGLQGIGSLSDILSITNNRRLESLRPLAVRSEGRVKLELKENPLLVSLEGLAGITDCSSLTVRGNARLESLLGLRGLRGPISKDLVISWNDILPSLRGLEGVRSIGGLRISGNTGLRSLAALGGIRGRLNGKFRVESNPELRSLHGLQHLTGQDYVPPKAFRGGDCFVVSGNSKLQSVEAIAGILSWNSSCFLNVRQQPLTSFQLEAVEKSEVWGSPGLLLQPAPQCFPNETRNRLYHDLSHVSVLPEPEWNEARCKECEACGVWRGLKVPCDLLSGRCRCPLGLQGKDCASSVPNVSIVENQTLYCAQPELDDSVALECNVSINVILTLRPGTPSVDLPGLGQDPFGVYARALGPGVTMAGGSGSSHHATWVNDTDGSLRGSIRVRLWSGNGSANLSLRVGYRSDVQPAHFIEGTVPRPSPALENMIFPWCVDSEDCNLIAPQRVVVLHCSGWVSGDGATCHEHCPVGRKPSNGRCAWDWPLLLGTGGSFALLLASFFVLAAQADADGPRALAVGLRRVADLARSFAAAAGEGANGESRPAPGGSPGVSATAADGPPALVGGLLGRRIPVHDVSLEDNRVLLRTWGRHYLRMGLRTSFRVSLTGTGCRGLDSPEKPLVARVVDKGTLELFNVKLVDDQTKKPLSSGAFSTSQGFVQLPLHLTIMHTGWLVPVAFSGPALLVAGACWLVWLCGRLYDDDIEGSEKWGWVSCVVGAALAGSAVGTQIRGRRSSPAPLHDRRTAYDKKCRWRNGPLVPVARGAERGISAGKLVDLHSFFQEFIRDRDMHYVVANIVKPLTAKSQLSFAEYAGPSRLDWFASHFWGSRFRHFCSSIQKHAEAVGEAVGANWQCQSYWVCSFSINQRDKDTVEEEVMGADYTDSSFYLALQSSSCQGTCMVVDEHALPLTRSWCLFELLVTMELERERRPGFKGLFFSTNTGVLKHGRASVETAMALGESVATLKLQDAGASVPADKTMIDGLVVDSMGGFDAMNRALRSRISAALRAAKARAMQDFELIDKKLTGNPSATTAGAGDWWRRPVSAWRRPVSAWRRPACLGV